MTMNDTTTIAFIVTLAVSLGYYQFIYIPQANAKPILPDEVLNPKDNAQVQIVEGAALESNFRNYVPKEVRGILGLSNKIVWTNNDPTTSHTVTTDEPHPHMKGIIEIVPNFSSPL